jgi:hypothetical protein
MGEGRHRTALKRDKYLSLPLTATSQPFRYSEIGLNLKELSHRLPSFCISPDLIAPDGGADVQQPRQMLSMRSSAAFCWLTGSFGFVRLFSDGT